MTAVVVIALGTACLAGIAVFVLALARMGAKPTPPVRGPVGEDEEAR